EETSISIVKIRVMNSGNTEINQVNIQLNFGNDANVYGGEFSGKLGVYRNHLRLNHTKNLADIGIDYINAGQYFDIDFYVGKYTVGQVEADMAKPGVKLEEYIENSLYEFLLDSLSPLSLTSFILRRIFPFY
ncbi:MAG: hypothetical protein ACKOQ2_28525, partial [Dolichospermum sp.]